MTTDLGRRVRQHRRGAAQGFTNKYKVQRLVWYESVSDPRTALTREKQIKKWRRTWKIALIEKANPTWKDLLEEIS